MTTITDKLALPPFIRAEVEKAIEAAKNQRGMSTHDGKATIGHDKLAYLLAVIDAHASPQAAPAPPQGAPAPQRKALTDEQIRREKPVCADFVSFRAGVRCAERICGVSK